MSNMEELKYLANNILHKPKEVKDQAHSTDTLAVLPVNEINAIIAALMYTLEHTTSLDFPITIRKSMLAALERLDD